jgi:16S rRNA processing protein RimM
MKALPLSEKFFFLRPDAIVYLHFSGNIQRFSIKSLRKLNSCFAVSFNEVTDREAAAFYRGALISCPADAEELREGEFLYEQIIGLSVVSTSGEGIGVVEDIFETQAHDVYVVRRGEKEYLIPAVREFIRDIQLAKKRIIVNKMKGLVE